MNRNSKQISDEELELAIRSFRQSVTAWSETEAARVKIGRERENRSMPSLLAWWTAAGAAVATVAVCALVAVMFTSGHKADSRQVAQSATAQEVAPSVSTPEAPAAQTADRAPAQHKPTTLEASLAPVANKAEKNTDDADEELLAGIDSDIAQATPKALAPMAGWMGDSVEQ